MKKINILIFTLVFMFSCSTVPVEEVDSQQATTVDLTSDSDTPSEAASDPMSDLDIGEPYVKIYFDYDQDALREDALSDLLKVSRLMKDNPKYTLLVEGHADERGTREYNLALSERRAKAVEDFLSASGVSSFNVEVVGYGEEKPVDNGSNESAWSQNRRAELFFIK